MDKRQQTDRRTKQIKVDFDRRKGPRRQYDKSNNNAYYLVFGFISFLLLSLGVISFIWGR